MIRKSLLLLAVLVVGLFILPACTGDNDGILLGVRTAGTIFGRVFDTTTDNPVDNVRVRISSTPYEVDTTGSGQVIIETSTDMNGNFNRTDIPNGFIEVKVNRDGYRTPESQFWSLSPGGTGEFRFDIAPGLDPVPEFEGDEQWARPPTWGYDPDM
jgi:hypothetical protein